MLSDNGGFHLLHVEIEKSKISSRLNSDLEIAVRSFLHSLDTVPNGKVFHSVDFLHSGCRELINKITLFVSNYPADQSFPIRSILHSAVFYVYQCLTDPPCPEEIEDDEESTVVGSHHWSLPNAEFEGYWENLIFDLNIKEKILNYADSMLKFADCNVDSSIITSNRLVLFHGPPGTGKTTLCKAIAQKLAIRLSKRYSHSQLLEINSHSLFSKWFSESGKLVMKMFDKIRELLEDEKCLVFVLIDEIESLTKARQSSLSSSEPSDAIRVVNALLTQIDQLRRYRNVLILTTSNLTNAVDDAFLDRADIKQYVGPPSDVAIYKILYSCIKELQMKHLIANEYISPNPHAKDGCGKVLFEISKKLLGTSGRTLRKLPVIAHALIGSPKIVDVATFLKGLMHAVGEMSMNETETNDGSTRRDADKKRTTKCSNPVMNGFESMPDENNHWNGIFVKEEPLDS